MAEGGRQFPRFLPEGLLLVGYGVVQTTLPEVSRFGGIIPYVSAAATVELLLWALPGLRPHRVGPDRRGVERATLGLTAAYALFLATALSTRVGVGTAVQDLVSVLATVGLLVGLRPYATAPLPQVWLAASTVLRYGPKAWAHVETEPLAVLVELGAAAALATFAWRRWSDVPFPAGGAPSLWPAMNSPLQSLLIGLLTAIALNRPGRVATVRAHAGESYPEAWWAAFRGLYPALGFTLVLALLAYGPEPAAGAVTLLLYGGSVWLDERSAHRARVAGRTTCVWLDARPYVVPVALEELGRAGIRAHVHAYRSRCINPFFGGTMPLEFRVHADDAERAGELLRALLLDVAERGRPAAVTGAAPTANPWSPL